MLWANMLWGQLCNKSMSSELTKLCQHDATWWNQALQMCNIIDAHLC
jgi:hypothetical protein